MLYERFAMKILILANNDIGLYKFRKELIEKLIENHEVHICLPKGEFVSKITELGCVFHDCVCLERHGKNPFRDFALLRFYIKLLKSVKPDIIFTYTIKPNIYGGMAATIHRIPYVVNVTGLGTALENDGVIQTITLLLCKLGLRNAKKVFFQNTENRNFMLKHGVVKTAYDLLPGSGVNLAQYEVLKYPDEDIVEFAFVARVMKEKGIDQYLDAAEYIRNKYPNTRFHVCGFCEGDYKAKLESLNDKGVIIYHGLVSDMKEIYKRTSCTVHPSYYPEGISNVLLESAASGRPIITTNRSGCREVIDDGVNGYIVEQKDSQDLIAKIEQFLALPQDARKMMGLAGRKKVEREFNREIVVKKYLEEL